MSVIDILTRVDSICKKYDKYDVEKQRETNVSGDDAFARLYGAVEADIEAALQVSSISTSSSTSHTSVKKKSSIRSEIELIEDL